MSRLPIHDHVFTEIAQLISVARQRAFQFVMVKDKKWESLEAKI